MTFTYKILSKKIVWFIDNKLGNLSGKDKTKPKILNTKARKLRN